MDGDRNISIFGTLLKPRSESAVAEPRPIEAPAESVTSGSSRLAFSGLYLFTLMLYIRPNDLFPDLFSVFPIVKIVAILTLLTYIGSRMSRGERLTIWPLEMKMLAVIVLLGLA